MYTPLLPSIAQFRHVMVPDVSKPPPLIPFPTFHYPSREIFLSSAAAFSDLVGSHEVAKQQPRKEKLSRKDM